VVWKDRILNVERVLTGELYELDAIRTASETELKALSIETGLARALPGKVNDFLDYRARKILEPSPLSEEIPPETGAQQN